MRDGADLGPRPQKLLEFFNLQLGGIVDGSHAQLGAFLFAQDLPGNDVRMVLHGGDQNFIAGAYVLATVGLSNQVDRFGGAAREDDLLVVRSMQEALDGRTSLFLELGP